jgi:hypothetical protein
MITQDELEKQGYEVLPKGAWFRIDSNMMPWEWDDVCKDFGVDTNCTEIILAIAGVKEIQKEEK